MNEKMSASELFEVVKDVPKEAWPNGCFYLAENDDDWWELSRQNKHTLVCRFPVVHAVSLFESSIMRWLLERAGERMVGSGVHIKMGCVQVGESRFVRPTFIEALAAAGKEINRG